MITSFPGRKVPGSHFVRSWTGYHFIQLQAYFLGRYYFMNPRDQVWPWLMNSVLRNSFIHSVFSLTTGPKPPPKRCLHIVRSRASSFKWDYLLLSLRSSSSFLRLLPRLLAISISLFIFPLITCFRRQFLHKMWPIQLAFRFLISSSHYLKKITRFRKQCYYTCEPLSSSSSS